MLLLESKGPSQGDRLHPRDALRFLRPHQGPVQLTVELATDLHRGFVEGGSPAQLRLMSMTSTSTSTPPSPLSSTSWSSTPSNTAFRPRGEGLVKVGFHELADGRIQLSVANNGVRFPAGIDLQGAHSIGLQIVSMLAQQVGGIMELGRDGGVCFTLTLGGTT